MRNKIAGLVIFVFTVFMLSACDNFNFLAPKKIKTAIKSLPQYTVKGTVIAKVNNLPITLEDLNQDIEQYNSNIPADKPELKITTREQKINYLKEQMVRRSLLYQEALGQGLDRGEEVARILEKTREDLLVVDLVRKEAAKAEAEVGSKEIEDYYNTYKEQLREPEVMQIREIAVPTESEAKEVLIQLLQGADFATLARERSKSDSAKNGGDLGPVKAGDKKYAYLETAAGTLDVGKISNYFKGPEGYYIIKLERKTGGKQKSLSEMWDDIKRALTFLKQQQRIDDLVGKLSRDAKIEIYEGSIK